MVVLKNKLFKCVIQDISEFKGISKDCKTLLETKYPHIPANTLGSILSTQVQWKMRSIYRKSPALNKKYYEEYTKCKKRGEPSGIILRMAAEVQIAPSLLARSILQHIYEDSSKYFKDTTLIEDRELAHEIYMSNLFDNEYGTFGNTIKQCIGQEYEQRLELYLKDMNISYIDESVLRNKGYDKTPDFKLIVPIAVDGFVINWIESKALFGDDVTHGGYLKDQYLCYWNRFGPGMVIYWFGYLEDVANTREINKMMIVRDHFPIAENITFMNPSFLET